VHKNWRSSACCCLQALGICQESSQLQLFRRVLLASFHAANEASQFDLGSQGGSSSIAVFKLVQDFGVPSIFFNERPTCSLRQELQHGEGEWMIIC
jgi:hypothetical protein